MAASLAFGIATTKTTTSTIPVRSYTSRTYSRRPTRISCSQTQWDPEGILGPPQTGHIARVEFKRRLEKDSEAKEEFERQIREEKERRAALRQSRVAPETSEQTIEYLLDTEAQEIEFEIARLRPRLNEEFFSHLQKEIGQIRFAVTKTEYMEDRLVELETLQKALKEGIEAYDKMQTELVMAQQSLTKILTSKDVKATLLDMVEENKLNRSLLTLLDQNIANAQKGNQTQAANFMEKVRGAVVKYMTV
ncbi:hypothetical protein ACFE04_011661 [Oxalis oulophora]